MRMSFHPGQAHVGTLKFDRESLVIDAQLMQNRGAEVANVNRIANDVVTKIVRERGLSERGQSRFSSIDFRRLDRLALRHGSSPPLRSCWRGVSCDGAW